MFGDVCVVIGLGGTERWTTDPLRLLHPGLTDGERRRVILFHDDNLTAMFWELQFFTNTKGGSGREIKQSHINKKY
uniref:Uncharacterized protein n=1 Tax=Leersia perrieri TaxID=77586 RepID=A0A0D9VWT9_9ORYZ